jgi:hypothetical protein
MLGSQKVINDLGFFNISVGGVGKIHCAADLLFAPRKRAAKWPTPQSSATAQGPQDRFEVGSSRSRRYEDPKHCRRGSATPDSRRPQLPIERNRAAR